LDSIRKNLPRFVQKGDVLGYLGNTGNAVNTPAHLHYSIVTVIPYLWHYAKNEPQAWKKVFYVNPGKLLTNKDIHKTTIQQYGIEITKSKV